MRLKEITPINNANNDKFKIFFLPLVFKDNIIGGIKIKTKDDSIYLNPKLRLKEYKRPKALRIKSKMYNLNSGCDLIIPIILGLVNSHTINKIAINLLCQLGTINGREKKQKYTRYL